MSNINREKQAQACANLLNQSGRNEYQAYGHSVALIADVLQEVGPNNWKLKGAPQVGSLLEAAGLSPDATKRVRSWSFSLLNPDNQKAYVPGLAKAAQRGSDAVLAHLTAKGVKTREAIKARCTGGGTGGKEANAKKWARVTLALLNEKGGDTALAVEAARIGKLGVLLLALNAKAAELATSTIATKAAPKATMTPKAGKSGKPLALNGGPANGLQHTPKAAPARRRTLTEDGTVELVTVDRGNAH